MSALAVAEPVVAPAVASKESPVKAVLPNRLASLDAYRGFVMLLMMAEVLHLGRVARALPDSGFWRFLGWHQSHVEWIGCSLHDLIQPSFSFLVGVALPFSIASRTAKAQSRWQMFAHAVLRAMILVLLAVVPTLRATTADTSDPTIERFLTHQEPSHPYRSRRSTGT